MLMLLIVCVVFRSVFAGTPHAVYGVPPAESHTYFRNPQPQRNPPVGYPVGSRWSATPHYQQPSSWGKQDYYKQSGEQFYFREGNHYRSSHYATPSVNPKPAASSNYRPYSGNAWSSQNYNGYQRFSPPNNVYSNQRIEPNNQYVKFVDPRYTEFLTRYYNWYYQNAQRASLERNNGYYPPQNSQPRNPSYPQPLGPFPDVTSGPGGSPSSSNLTPPWWLPGGFTGPTPAASTSSGGPVGPFVELPPLNLPTDGAVAKKTPSTSTSMTVSGAAPLGAVQPPVAVPPGTAMTVMDRVNEDSASQAGDTSKSDLETTAEDRLSSDSGASSSSKEGSSPSPVESSSPSSEESSSASSEDSPSSSSEESTSAPSSESSSASSEESSSPSSEESSSASSEDSPSSSSEESTSAPSSESSSASSEESSSASSEESSSASSEDSPSSSSEESTSAPSSESSSASSSESSSVSSDESSSASSDESSSASSGETTSLDNVTTESSDSSETNTIKNDE